MARINTKTKNIYCKIVYYGPASAGKSTNLYHIHQSLPCIEKSEIYHPRAEGLSEVLFDVAPAKEFVNIKGFQVFFRVHTVSGTILYQDALVKVLDGVDGVVFVAHSQDRYLQLNLDILQNLSINIAQTLQQRVSIPVTSRNSEHIPVVLQYNKRDLPDILPISLLDAQLNKAQWSYHEAIAMKGLGVLETFQDICKLVVARL